MASNWPVSPMIEQREFAYQAVMARARQCELAERDQRSVRQARAQRFAALHTANVKRWTR